MKPVCEGVEAEAFPAFSTRAQIVALACGCAGLSSLLLAIDPHQHAVFPACLLYQTTGIYCAGCGATRAAHALLTGRLMEAVHDNLLFTVLLPVVVGWLGLFVVRAWTDEAWPTVQLSQGQALKRGGLFFALLLTFMILRNLPGSPFSLLRPV